MQPGRAVIGGRPCARSKSHQNSNPNPNVLDVQSWPGHRPWLLTGAKLAAFNSTRMLKHGMCAIIYGMLICFC